MKRQLFPRWYAVVLGCITLATIASAQTTTTRDLRDFLNAQGTSFPGYPGPVAGFLGSGDLSVPPRLMSVDYAGLVNRCWPDLHLPTGFSGTIIERPLRDQRAEVTVILHVQNALTWVALGDFASGPVLFGQRWSTAGVCGDIATSGLTDPVLGDYFMELVFINYAPGAPLPDLLQLFFAPNPGQEVRTMKVHAKAVGPLYNLPGIDDGTPGMASTQQVGLLYKYGTHGKPAIDGFTVERIDLKPVGKK